MFISQDLVIGKIHYNGNKVHTIVSILMQNTVAKRAEREIENRPLKKCPLLVCSEPAWLYIMVKLILTESQMIKIVYVCLFPCHWLATKVFIDKLPAMG